MKRFTTLLCLLFAVVGFAAAQPAETVQSTEERLQQKLAGISIGPAPLAGAAIQLGNAANLEIRLQWDALAQAGIDRTVPVTMRLAGAGVSRRAVIETFCRLAGGPTELAWTIDKHVVSVTTRFDQARTPARKTYRLVEMGLSPEQVREFIPELTSQSITVKDEQATFSASPTALAEVEQLLSLCARGMSSQDWLGLMSACNILQADRKFSFDWKGKAFDECLAELSSSAGVPVVLDTVCMKAGGVDSRQAVSLELRDVTAAQAMEQLLKSAGGGAGKLAVEPVGCGEVLCVTTAPCVRSRLAAFAVNPESLPSLGAESIQDLPRVIRSRVAPESWNASARILPAGQNRLLCLQTWDNLARIGALVRDPVFLASPKLVALPQLPPPPVEDPRLRPIVVSSSDQPQSQAGRLLREAEALQKAGLTDPASDKLREIVRTYPDSPEAAAARKKLGSHSE